MAKQQLASTVGMVHNSQRKGAGTPGRKEDKTRPLIAFLASLRLGAFALKRISAFQR